MALCSAFIINTMTNLDMKYVISRCSSKYPTLLVLFLVVTFLSIVEFQNLDRNNAMSSAVVEDMSSMKKMKFDGISVDFYIIRKKSMRIPKADCVDERNRFNTDDSYRAIVS